MVRADAAAVGPLGCSVVRGPADRHAEQADAAAVAPQRVLVPAEGLDLLRPLAGGRWLPADFRSQPRAGPAPGDRPVGMLGGAAAGPGRSLRGLALLQARPDGPGDADHDLIHPPVRTRLAVLAAPEVLVAPADGWRRWWRRR